MTLNGWEEENGHYALNWYKGKGDEGRLEKKANQNLVHGMMLRMGSLSLPGFKLNEQRRSK